MICTEIKFDDVVNSYVCLKVPIIINNTLSHEAFKSEKSFLDW